MLAQTSEWQGTLFSKPDTVDHNRVVGGGDNSAKGTPGELAAPACYWEYNDVRVNVLSLALLHRFRRSLAEVLKERIMAPIGASDRWSWHAYRNAMVEIDGRDMPSVPGGHLIFIDCSADLVVVARWLDVAARAAALRGIYGALA